MGVSKAIRLRVFRLISTWLLSSIMALGLAFGAASAQTLSDSDRAQLEAKKEALFQQMLREPANLDVTFAYADVSARLGDNEAAVSALERMLLFNPNLPRVDLELGALYFRMGSFEMARSYFDKAEANNPPPEVRTRIAQYEGQITTDLSPQQFSGYLFFGAQYQSDANVSPGSPLIQSPIGEVLLSSQFLKRHDNDIFATGAMLYSYDLGTQDRDTFEVGATGFADHYAHLNQFDLDLAEINAGPRFRFPDPAVPVVQSATVRPYLIANEVGLGEAQYFYTYGAGLEGTAAMPWDINLKGIFEFRQKEFSNDAFRPLSTGLTGSDKLVTLLVSKLVTPASALGVELDYLNQDTRFAYYANNTFSVSASYKIRYPDPTGILHQPLETALFGSRSWGYYEAPDPCCSTSSDLLSPGFSNRYDRHWRIGLSETFPVNDTVAIVAQLQRDVVSSNLPIYAYTSNSGLVGVQIRF